MDPHVILGALDDRLWYLALAFGGLSVVATTIASRSWRQFQDTLKAPLAPDTSDLPYLREWGFRYWRRIGLVAAGFSILFSILWLIL